ncbi:Dabb family protein [Hwanghaeella sp. 1Z406]|uniref:Dabb family protein n=1 Tax=Hwanghaeella sp. 1Z406 TaxID=3402811 RepID=UPI003B6725B2
MSVFYHVVMMKYRDGADAAFHEKVQEYCQAIQEACAGVLSYDYATNKATRSQGYDFAILARFESEDHHDAYQIDPNHVAMKTFMATQIEKMVVLDCTAS